MTIEVWSDVMCPFCYIAKKRLDSALNQFQHKDSVTVVWRSFQLNPYLPADESMTTVEYLSQTKGWSADYTESMNAMVKEMARDTDIVFNFDQTKVINTNDAHRLLHHAKAYNQQEAVMQHLFYAHFTLGLTVADKEVLMGIGKTCGLDEFGLLQLLQSNEWSEAIEQDIKEAKHLGINGVPYYIFNRQFAVSGAQSVETFSSALEKAYTFSYAGQ